MTKAKAMELMLEMARDLIEPTLARKIAKAFGYTLKDLGIKPKKVSEYYRATPYAKNLSAVSNHHLAEAIYQEIIKDNTPIERPFHGVGRNAEHVTEQSVGGIKFKLKLNQIETAQELSGRMGVEGESKIIVDEILKK